MPTLIKHDQCGVFTNVKLEVFQSIDEFVKHISSKSNNAVMHGKKQSCDTGYLAKLFTGTSSYDEASQLLEFGDKMNAEKLTVKLGQVKKQFETQGKRVKSEYSVVGHQASVPRYLQGIPQNMIMQKKVPQKQKVIKVVKSIGYHSEVTTDQIFENSAKALLIVEKLEAMGYRVELDIVQVARPSYEMNYDIRGFVLNVKKSSERLNISKLAFPLVHTSMHRRIGFKWREVSEVIDNNEFRYGYGYSISSYEDLKQIFKNEYVLPGFIDDPQEVIDNWKL